MFNIYKGLCAVLAVISADIICKDFSAHTLIYSDLSRETHQTEKWTLDNGIKLILISKSDCENAAFNITFNAGQIDEESFNLGIANLVKDTIIQMVQNKFANEPNTKIICQLGLDSTSYSNIIIEDKLELLVATYKDIINFPIPSLDEEKLTSIACKDSYALYKNKDTWRATASIINSMFSHTPTTFKLDELYQYTGPNELTDWITNYYTTDGAISIVISRRPLKDLRSTFIPLLADFNRLSIQTRGNNNKYHITYDKFCFIESLEDKNLLYVSTTTSPASVKQCCILPILSSLTNKNSPHYFLSNISKDIVTDISLEISHLGSICPLAYIVKMELTNTGTSQWQIVLSQLIQAFKNICAEENSIYILSNQNKPILLTQADNNSIIDFLFKKTQELSSYNFQLCPNEHTMYREMSQYDLYKASRLIDKTNICVVLCGNITDWLSADDGLQKSSMLCIQPNICIPDIPSFTANLPILPKIQSNDLTINKPIVNKTNSNQTTINEVSLRHEFFPCSSLQCMNDKIFKLPRSVFSIRLETDLHRSTTPYNKAFLIIYDLLMSRTICSDSTKNSLGAYELSIFNAIDSSVILCSLWEENITIAFANIINMIRTLSTNEEQFNNIKQEAITKINNEIDADTYMVAISELKRQLHPNSLELQYIKQALSDITFSEFKETISSFNKTLDFEMFILKHKHSICRDFLVTLNYTNRFLKEKCSEIHQNGPFNQNIIRIVTSSSPEKACLVALDVGSCLDTNCCANAYVVANIINTELKKQFPLYEDNMVCVDICYGRLLFIVFLTSRSDSTPKLKEDIVRFLNITSNDITQTIAKNTDLLEKSKNECIVKLNPKITSMEQLCMSISQCYFEYSKKENVPKQILQAISTLQYDSICEWINTYILSSTYNYTIHINT